LHGAVVDRRQNAPVGLLAMGDVFVVVVILDPVHVESWILVDQAAALAADEVKPPRLAGQVVLGGDEGDGGAGAPVVAGDTFQAVQDEAAGHCGAGHERVPSLPERVTGSGSRTRSRHSLQEIPCKARTPARDARGACRTPSPVPGSPARAR